MNEGSLAYDLGDFPKKLNYGGKDGEIRGIHKVKFNKLTCIDYELLKSLITKIIKLSISLIFSVKKLRAGKLSENIKNLNHN